MTTSKFRRGALGQAITVMWPGGAVAAVLFAFSTAPSLSLAERAVVWVLAGSALAYGLVMMRRIRLCIDETGLFISNGVRKFQLEWSAIAKIDVEEVRVLGAGGMYGLVVHPTATDRGPVVVRASLMLGNRAKQRVLDQLHREVRGRDIHTALPRKARNFWVGPRASEPLV